MTHPTRLPPEAGRQTTINVQPERRGGGMIAFIVGGLVVLVAAVALVLWNGGGDRVREVADTTVDVDVNLPSLPDTPRIPETPTLPPIEPPTVPQPGPAPAN